jgi:hypothetical protein
MGEEQRPASSWQPADKARGNSNEKPGTRNPSRALWVDPPCPKRALGIPALLGRQEDYPTFLLGGQKNITIYLYFTKVPSILIVELPITGRNSFPSRGCIRYTTASRLIPYVPPPESASSPSPWNYPGSYLFTQSY